jgi:hypothetical protein
VCVVASALLIAPVFSIHYDFLFANGVSINIGENCNLNGPFLGMDFFVTVNKTRGADASRVPFSLLALEPFSFPVFSQ